MAVEQQHKVVGTDKNRNRPTRITGMGDKIHNRVVNMSFEEEYGVGFVGFGDLS